MNAPLRLVLLLCSTGLLSACASTVGTVSDARASRPAPTQGIFVTDREYMARVQSTAVRRGIDVHWVHPPVKRVAGKQ